MKRTILTLACLVTLVGLGGLALADVVGSKHDLSSGGSSSFTATNVDRVCVFCHTPHMASGASGQYPLWNHTLSATASYGTYSSSSLQATDVTDIGTTNTIGSAAVSNLCMSCHDGTVGTGSLYNDPNQATPDNSATTITGAANMGTDLTDDHPVNFTYDSTLAGNDGSLEDPSTNSTVAALLVSGKVQCSSCHDPHSTTFSPFLVADNTNSGLCTTCHQQ